MTYQIRRADILAQLEAAQTGCTARTLDANDVDRFLAEYRRLRAKARRKGLDVAAVYVRLDGGGASARARRWNPQTTEIRIDGGRVTVRRVNAASNSRASFTSGFHGRGNGGIRAV